MRVPPKVKVFGWKLSHDILPTYLALTKRRILSDPICPRCSVAEETTTHAIRDCAKARNIWAEAPCKNEWLAIGDSHPLQWLSAVAKKVSKESFEEGLMLCWAIWNNRNKKIKERYKQEALLVTRTTFSYLHEVRMAQNIIPKAEQTEKVKWNPPAEGTYKVNFDGALRAEIAVGGVGW
ncbi:hypothetical protein PTKIN_Ptkin10aG0005200 [Pterospermum kingtungense]